MPSYLDRTFGYRRLYVDAIVERAPRRARLAVAAEVARLGFVIFGCALVALVGWALTAGAAARPGASGWTLVFGACSLIVTLLGLRATAAALTAVRDMRRITEAVTLLTVPKPEVD